MTKELSPEILVAKGAALATDLASLAAAVAAKADTATLSALSAGVANGSALTSAGIATAGGMVATRIQAALFNVKGNARPDGTGDDDTAAIQSTLNIAGYIAGAGASPQGVTVQLSPMTGTGRYRVSNLSIPAYVTLDLGQDAYRTKRPRDLNYARGALQLSGTITYTHGSSVRNGYVIKDNMTFPQMGLANTWTGTAFAAAGNSASECVFERLSIVGFNQAVDHNPPGWGDRPIFKDINIDCRNGLRMLNVYDVAIVENIHSWNVATNDNALKTRDDMLRDGTFLAFENVGDWIKVFNCFSYGYQTGTYINGCKQMQLFGVSHDYPASRSSADTRTAFKIRGDVRQVTIFGGHAAGNAFGIDIDCPISGSECSIVTVNGTQFWNTKIAPIRVNRGVVNVSGGTSFRGFKNLLQLETNFGSQSYDSVSINDISVNWDSSVSATTQNSAVGADPDSGTQIEAAFTPVAQVAAIGGASSFAGSRVVFGERLQYVGTLAPATPGASLPTIAFSGTSISPPIFSDTFNLSGTGTMNNIFAGGSRLRRIITLIGAPGANVTIGTTGNISLNGSNPKTITNGVVVQLMLINNAPTWQVLN